MNGTILVVDDDADCLQVVLQACNMSGAVIQSASNGEDALRLLQEDTISLLLTDLEMPDMNGFQLASEAKALRPDLRIVMMTGNLPPEKEHLIAEAGIEGILEKPFTVTKLKKVLGLEL